jgi:hypothetical protein
LLFWLISCLLGVTNTSRLVINAYLPIFAALSFGVSIITRIPVLRYACLPAVLVRGDTEVSFDPHAFERYAPCGCW